MTNKDIPFLFSYHGKSQVRDRTLHYWRCLDSSLGLTLPITYCLRSYQCQPTSQRFIILQFQCDRCQQNHYSSYTHLRISCKCLALHDCCSSYRWEDQAKSGRFKSQVKWHSSKKQRQILLWCLKLGFKNQKLQSEMTTEQAKHEPALVAPTGFWKPKASIWNQSQNDKGTSKAKPCPGGRNWVLEKVVRGSQGGNCT